MDNMSENQHKNNMTGITNASSMNGLNDLES